MPTSVGPNPALDSNIIFSYDVGDTSNSYRGEPTTNTVGNLNSFNPLDLYTWASSGNTSTWSRDTTIFPSPVNGIPLKEVSSGTDSYSSTYNNFGNNISAASSGQTWTISIYALAAAGTNLQIWIFGSNSSGNYIELDARYFTATGVWQRISISMTFTNGSTAYVQARVATATNGATVWWDGLQVEQKSYPTQFTTGTRSATQGLLPLISNTTINLSSVSFTSNAQITYDGTDDHIDLGNLGTIGTTYSIECVFNSSAVTSYRNIFDMNYATYPGVTGNVGPRLEQISNSGISIIWSGVTNSNSLYNSTDTFAISANTNYHVVFVQNGSSGAMFVNGILRSQVNNAQGYIQTFGDVNLGRGFSLAGDRYFIGSLPLFKIYNQALSADQVQQNYRQYKSRFNLS
jgi:hypothetical protein